MATLLKDMFNPQSLHDFALALKSVYKSFPVEKFMDSILNESWGDLALKARCRRISLSLGRYLPQEYQLALPLLERAVKGYSFAIFFPDFIEVYGQDEENWDLSIHALERNTEYWSSEFAVRAFIIKNEERMMRQMLLWSKHKNEHVRRLASEGCRPKLPWGKEIPQFRKDPTPILPILKQLKTDSSLYVRKSVANNLNDISKTHPDLVIKLAKEWYGNNKDTDWILKHGCRTLLKKGNSELLALFGYGDSHLIHVQDFTLEKASLLIGENLVFSFMISVTKPAKIRLEYAIDYVKANGKANKKIFKISEISLKQNQQKTYIKKHSFADVSVRRHYSGTHSITLIVNGLQQGKLDFELKV